MAGITVREGLYRFFYENALYEFTFGIDIDISCKTAQCDCCQLKQETTTFVADTFIL